MNRSQIPPDFRYREVARKGRPVHAPLDAFSIRHPAMPLSRRAKIFSPFDALKGFREAITAEDAIHGTMVEAGASGRTDVGAKTSKADPQSASGEIVMCTRFYIDISDKELQEIVAAAESSALAKRFLRAGAPMRSSGEIRPTDVAPVIAMARSGNRTVFPMRWGFHVAGLRGADTISLILNARSETAAQKRTFRESWQQHRCVVPASYYFEWEHFLSPRGAKKIGRKYAIQPKGSSITWLCGLYRIEEGFPHFVVLTRPPAEEIAFIHDRMPVILPEDRILDWIRPGADPDQTLRYALDDMVCDKAV